jgi:hypothetical protein
MVCKEIENEFGLEASFLILHKDMSKDMGKKQKTNGRGIRVCVNKSKALQGVWDKSDNFILVEVVLGKESAKDIECIHSETKKRASIGRYLRRFRTATKLNNIRE